MCRVNDNYLNLFLKEKEIYDKHLFCDWLNETPVNCVNVKPINTKRLTFVFITEPKPPIQLSYWKATQTIKFRSQRSQSYSCKTMQLVQAAAPLIKGSLIG